MSAAELGRSLGDALPQASTVTDAEVALVEATRDLLDVIVATSADVASRIEATELIRRAVDVLASPAADDPVRIVRHPDGRIENLIQAGTGRLNPRGLRLRFDEVSLPAANEARPVEVLGRVTLGASASGPPGRAHGGVVASILDEALGMAMMRAGRVGMTATIEVSYLAAVPLHTEIDVHARVTEIDGRKTRVTGELSVSGAVAARGSALFIAGK